jgi:hypothetical protein
MMKKTIMKVLATSLVLAFLFPAAAFGATGKTGGQTAAKPKANKQAAAQLTPEERQARRQERREAKKARFKEKREQALTRKIARLQKAKAAMEEKGKTADPKYQKVVDRLADLQARLGELKTNTGQ